MRASECVWVIELHHQLLQFFEPADALLWLVTPQSALGGGIPCEIVGTPGGVERIHSALKALEDGAFS